MSLNDESYFDDMITLYIGKGVANFKMRNIRSINKIKRNI